MAERRMFTKKITDDENFMTLSSSAQALYLHLSMCADDDGFSNQVSVCMFKAHASIQDLQALLEKRYIYQFENGVIVIKHWRMANALRKDRYTPTVFKEELSKLRLKDNGSYTMTSEDEFTRLPFGCHVVADCLPQDRIGKDSIGNIKESNTNVLPKKKFIPPNVDEVKEYLSMVGSKVDAESFVAFYESKDWIIGKNKMKNWKSAIVTWEKRNGLKRTKPKTEVVFNSDEVIDLWGDDDANI